MKAKQLKVIGLLLMFGVSMIMGCSTKPTTAKAEAIPQSTTVAAETSTPEPTVTPAAESDLEGHTLMIYCGAGMTKPFEEIANTFEKATSCKMQVTYANAGQIQAQINTVQEGDLFIAGSQDELKPIEESIVSSVPLVKHIPVLAVQKGNPKDIKSIQDLTRPEISVVLGDGEATPIGKIANKVLTDLGILKKVNVLSRATTAPAIATALATGECDAIIVWKENTKDPNVEVIDTEELESYIKKVPAATLSYGQDQEAIDTFLQYLQQDEAQAIWESYGYEIIE